MWIRLSLLLGQPVKVLKRSLTAAEWAEYQVADSLGLVPDNSLIMQMLTSICGAEKGEAKQQEITSSTWQTRRARYGKVKHV